jgi:hypothetical protein
MTLTFGRYVSLKILSENGHDEQWKINGATIIATVDAFSLAATNVSGSITFLDAWLS